MATRATIIEPRLYDYIVESSFREPEILRNLREETARLPQAECQISAEQGQFMCLLAQLIGAKRLLEVGTFTGYSSLAVALGLADDARMVCCDVSDEWTSIARRYWKEAGVAEKIELRIGPGTETLDAMLNNGERGSFDMAFVDANKEDYPRYYEQVLGLLRIGGVVLFDNMLVHGRVADPEDRSAYVETMRSVNIQARDDDRVTSSLLSIGDGVLMAVRRK